MHSAHDLLKSRYTKLISRDFQELEIRVARPALLGMYIGPFRLLLHPSGAARVACKNVPTSALRSTQLPEGIARGSRFPASAAVPAWRECRCGSQV